MVQKQGSYKEQHLHLVKQTLHGRNRLMERPLERKTVAHTAYRIADDTFTLKQSCIIDGLEEYQFLIHKLHNARTIHTSFLIQPVYKGQEVGSSVRHLGSSKLCGACQPQDGVDTNFKNCTACATKLNHPSSVTAAASSPPKMGGQGVTFLIQLLSFCSAVIDTHLAVNSWPDARASRSTSQFFSAARTRSCN